MNKIELLAPAKDLAKAKVAVDYGANAVYIGGKDFSLRSRASNFSHEDIIEIVEYAHAKDVKIYVTVNIVFHNEDFVGIKEYLLFLRDAKVDGIIVASLAVLRIAKDIVPELEVHVSTQNSSLNSGAVEYLKSLGADRVVLARECSMADIQMIAEKKLLPLEVFIHGGMCSNYSGRCVLSNRMTNRDANRGGCAHSCRWLYHVYNNGYLVSKADEPLSLSSKDLRATAYIEDMIKCGVSSLKIEGRMKSDYYIAQVVKTYRKMIDEIYYQDHLDEERIAYYDNELAKAENRPSDDGFLSGTADGSKQLFGVNGAGVTHEYIALVKDYDIKRSLALVEVKNAFDIGEQIEAFGPIVDNEQFVNMTMFDSEWKYISEAHKPTDLVYVRIPFRVYPGDMLRKVRQ